MKSNRILLYIMVIISVILCVPSIIYLIFNGTVDGFNSYYTYTLSISDNDVVSITSGILLIGLLLLFSVIYLLIIKKEKHIFKNKKEVIVFITIIAAIFMIILPYLSSDIYYYIGDSWLCSKYHENPYYTTVKDLQDRGINDEILNNTGYWKHTVTVYGPLYNIISIILSFFSFGNITLALYIFKMVSLIVHILNSVIIGKITKSKKYMLLYGLNPLILIELLSNVHNDIYLILFLLLALYFLVRKKNILLTTVFLAFSMAIKFSTILIVPFILLYCFRKEKIFKRIKYCVLCGISIVTIVLLLYMPFYKDFSIFTNMLVQGGRYSQSIMTLLMVKLRGNNIFEKINKFKLPIFAIIYAIIVIRILFARKINLKNILNKYNLLMLIFIFICLTNFQRWYILWLIPTIIWQNKYMRYFIINLTFTSIIPLYAYFKIENDAFSKGIYYSLMTIVLAIGVLIISVIYNKIVLYLRRKNVKISFNRWK